MNPDLKAIRKFAPRKNLLSLFLGKS